jgi:hypothetical protein
MSNANSVPPRALIVSPTQVICTGLLAVTAWTARPDTDTPIAQPQAEVIRPAPEGRLTGRATWYAYVPGGAAAGPALRKWLGKGWRGTKVTVCHGAGNCVRVTLSDWCLCSKGNRIIDLDVRAFASLVPTSRGITSVTVTR